MLLATLLLPLPALAAPPQDRRRITPVVEVVREARPAVVYIQSNVPRRRQDIWGRIFDMDQETSGSGVVIYEDGYIVTNYHVVRGANRMTVRFDAADDGTVYEARLVSKVEEEDLALLKIDPREGQGPFPTIPLGSDPILGETVIAIGNPYGQTHTVSTGIVSGLHRDIEASNMRFTNLIQTDASVNPGNSGGPLLNINGELIGINTAVNLQAENIGFAIPVDRVKRALKEELLDPNQARSWLGYEIEGETLVVSSVVPGGPAERAGLRVGDRLLAIGGRSIESEEDYRLALLPIQPEEEVAVAVGGERGSRELTFRAWNALDGFLWRRVGLTLEPIVIGRGYERTVRVVAVQKDGPAASLGLRPGDVIATMKPAPGSARPIRGVEDFAFVVSRVPPGTEITLEMWRDDDHDGAYEYTADYSELYSGTLEAR